MELRRNAIGIAVGIAGILVALLLYVHGRARAEPVYAVSPVEVVARIAKDGAALRLFWADEEIPNAASVHVALWNKGNRHIDSSEFVQGNPVRIVPSEPVNILAVTVVRTSRKDLGFRASIDVGGDLGETVVVRVEGDEALESGDGVLLHILFSGSPECRWQVWGRVKGARRRGTERDFEELNWQRVHGQAERHAWRDTMVFGALFLAMLAVWAVFYRRMRRMYGPETPATPGLKAFVGQPHFPAMIIALLFLASFVFALASALRLSNLVPSWLN